MRISTFWYCLKQGLINICRNILFSLASIATISACIFLFCLFFAVIANAQHMVKSAESTVGITVFFDEALLETDILKIGKVIEARSEIKSAEYMSADEAWENFKEENFMDYDGVVSGFNDDNPLAGSASYNLFLHDIGQQDEMVAFLEDIPGVRRVNYSNSTAVGLVSFNKMVGLLSAVIIGVLLAVAMFLISNTISVAATFRKNETKIMRLIGATDFMIRAPFVVEGVIIGYLGAALPLAGMYFLYKNAIIYIKEKFTMLSGIIEFLPIDQLFPSMVIVALVLGVGVGFVVSFLTIRKDLRV